jgi:hypothetical protein
MAVESRVEFRVPFLFYMCNLYAIPPVGSLKKTLLFKNQCITRNDRVPRSMDILVIDTILSRFLEKKHKIVI